MLKESTASTRALKSIHLDLTVEGQINNFPIKTLSGDLTQSPAVAGQGNTKLTFQGSDVDAKFVVIDSNLYVALSGDSYIDMGPAADVYDISAILNPDKGLANVLANFSDPKSESTETVNGVETVKVTGQVSADAVNAIAPPIKASGPVPGTAWIEKDGDHKLVQAKLEPSDGTSVQMTLSDWDKPVTVTKPAV
ncbi:MAG: lipoprotein LprG [Mycobacterium sp.]|nr:lipoprotein LprG [Mycobacterium sp.]